jgi:CYTH domain-containing protein
LKPLAKPRDVAMDILIRPQAKVATSKKAAIRLRVTDPRRYLRLAD